MTPANDTGAPTLLVPDGPNAISRTLGLLGDEWNLLIIRQALLGAVRYSQFMAQLPISNSVLTNRLKALVRDALLTRQVHVSSRACTEYQTTPRCRSLWPVFLSIWAWECTWAGESNGEPTLRHLSCGQQFLPVLRCASCQAQATDANVSLVLGPSGAWARSAPAAATRRRSDPNPAERHPRLFPETMGILGNRWAAALLLAAFLGTTRFTSFQSQLGAPPSLLAERLHTFCDIGVLTTAPTERFGPERAAYLLTDKGHALFPVIVTALQWAEEWFRAPEGPAVVTAHADCEADFIGELACDQCTNTLQRREITAIVT